MRTPPPKSIPKNSGARALISRRDAYRWQNHFSSPEQITGISATGHMELLEVFSLFCYVQRMKTNSNMSQWLNLESPPALYILNHYQCPECEHLWDDRWNSEAEDDCPGCGERHITPIGSEDQSVLFKCQAITSAPGAFRS
jgi:hypothetical protein